MCVTELIYEFAMCNWEKSPAAILYLLRDRCDIMMRLGVDAVIPCETSRIVKTNQNIEFRIAGGVFIPYLGAKPTTWSNIIVQIRRGLTITTGLDSERIGGIPIDLTTASSPGIEKIMPLMSCFNPQLLGELGRTFTWEFVSEYREKFVKHGDFLPIVAFDVNVPQDLMYFLSECDHEYIRLHKALRKHVHAPFYRVFALLVDAGIFPSEIMKEIMSFGVIDF